MKKVHRAAILVVAFLVTLLLSLGIGIISRSPKNNLVWLSDFKPTTANSSYQSISGWVGYYRYGYIVVLSTRDNENFEYADYVIVRRLNGNFSVDILTGPGKTVLLSGQSAQSYLANHSIDTSDFDRKWKSFTSQ